MLNLLATAGRLLRALIILYLCLWAGDGIATLLPFALPGSIIGMLILFALLTSQLVNIEWVKPGGHLLMRNMLLLFIPISVGIMVWWQVLLAQFGPLMVSCFVSTFLVLLTVGYCSEKIHRANTPTEQDDA